MEVEIYGDVQVLKESWHIANLDRRQTEYLLAQEPRGTFIVRQSSNKGHNVLSVSIGSGKVTHYLIIDCDGGCCFKSAPQRVFSSLNELIERVVKDKLMNGVFQRPCDVKKLFKVHERPSTTPRTGSTGTGTLTRPSLDGDDDDDDDDDDDVADQGTFCSSQRNILSSISALQLLSTPATEQLTQYVTNTNCADVSAAKKNTELKALNSMLLDMAQPLLRELDEFERKLQLVSNVFERASHMQQYEHYRKRFPEAPRTGSDMDNFLQMLDRTKQIVEITQSHAKDHLKHVVCKHSPTAPQQQQEELKLFRVTRVNQMLKNTVTLAVNFKDLTLKMGDSTDAKIFKHDEILKVIKSRSNKLRLGLQTAQKRRDFAFQSFLDREAFCQAIQQIKDGDSDAQTAGLHRDMNVFIGTFNMGDTVVPKEQDLSYWFKCNGTGTGKPCDISGYDIIAVGTQESGGSEKDWLSCVKQILGNDFYQVSYAKLLQIRLVVFLKTAHQNLLSHVQTGHVATGIANRIGNKGGVGISFFLDQTSFCFLNCHLAANQNKVVRRNANIRDIIKKLQLGQKKLNGFDITSQFHYAFWFGDMNYRLSGTKDEVEYILNNKGIPELVEIDQLRANKNRVLSGFDEGKINFLPTYRFVRGQRKEYSWIKQKKSGPKVNVPSYCDRVLVKTFPNLPIKQLAYGCTTNIVSSDHSPVYATYNIAVRKQYVRRHTQKTQTAQCCLEIESANAGLDILSDNDTKVHLEFYGTFFPKSVRSGDNSSGVSGAPAWSAENNDFPAPIIPVVPEIEYLSNEHLLVAVVSSDSEEVLAVGCISVRDFLGPAFGVCDLTSGGARVGKLQIVAQFKNVLGEQSTLFSEDDVRHRQSIGAGSDKLQRVRSTVITGTRKKSRSPSFSGPLGDYEDANQFFDEDAEDSAPPPLPPRANSGTLQKPTQLHSPPGRSLGRQRPFSMIEPHAQRSTIQQSQPSQNISFQSSILYDDPDEVLENANPIALPPRRHQSLVDSGMQRGRQAATGTANEHASSAQRRPSLTVEPQQPATEVLGMGPQRPRQSSSYDVPKQVDDSGTLVKEPVKKLLTTQEPPTSVQDFFRTLGYPSLTPIFIDAGYDDIDFFCDISDEDLVSLGVTDPTTRLKILESISQYSNV